MGVVKLAVPKGSLEKETFEILERAWYKVSSDARTYRPIMSDPEIELKTLRPQEIPVYIAEGMQDVGITGRDWIRETSADVEVLLDLEYGAVRLVVAVPDSIPVNSFSELCKYLWSGGRQVRISTEYLNISTSYVKSDPVYQKHFGDEEPLVVTPWWKRGSNTKAVIYLSFGATEAKPPEDADAIIDVTQTGRSLEQNKLKIIGTVMESTALLVANRKALADTSKREKIYDILTLLRGVIDADKKLHIFVNVKKENLQKLISQLPALRRPTVSPLSEEGWFSVNTVVARTDFFKLLPTLRRLAQGLVVHYPRQILPLEEIARDEGEGARGDKV